MAPLRKEKNEVGREEVVFKGLKLIDKSPHLTAGNRPCNTGHPLHWKYLLTQASWWNFWKWLRAMSPDLINGLIPWWGHEMMALLGCDAYLEKSGHCCPALEIYSVPGPLLSLYISWLPENEQSPSPQAPVTMSFFSPQLQSHRASQPWTKVLSLKWLLYKHGDLNFTP